MVDGASWMCWTCCTQGNRDIAAESESSMIKENILEYILHLRKAKSFRLVSVAWPGRESKRPSKIQSQVAVNRRIPSTNHLHTSTIELYIWLREKRENSIVKNFIKGIKPKILRMQQMTRWHYIFSGRIGKCFFLSLLWQHRGRSLPHRANLNPVERTGPEVTWKLCAPVIAIRTVRRTKGAKKCKS